MPPARASRKRETVIYKEDSEDENLSEGHQHQPPELAWSKHDYESKEETIEVQEEDGTWRAATLYRRKDSNEIVLWFGDDEYEGTSGGYTLINGQITDPDGDPVPHRVKPPEDGKRPRKKPKKAAKQAKAPGKKTVVAAVLGRIIEKVDDSIDALAQIKVAVKLRCVSKDWHDTMASDPDAIWLRLVSQARKLPILDRHIPKGTPTSLQSTALTQALHHLPTACVECWDRVPSAVHPTYRVPICGPCCTKKKGLVVHSNAKGFYRVTEGMLSTLPHTTKQWYGKPSKLYCKRHVVLLQDQRYGSMAAFKAANSKKKPYNPGSLYSSGMLNRGYDYYDISSGYQYGGTYTMW